MTDTLNDISSLEVFGRREDGRFVVVNSQPWMADGLTQVQRACFPDLAEAELMGPEHYRMHVKVFPEGQFAVWDTEQGRVAASSTDLRMNVDFAHFAHPYMDEVGNNTLSTHLPHGEWLYGADIGVHPAYRAQGLSTLLYTARRNLSSTRLVRADNLVTLFRTLGGDVGERPAGDAAGAGGSSH